jgi:hypothetical protein
MGVQFSLVDSSIWNAYADTYDPPTGTSLLDRGAMYNVPSGSDIMIGYVYDYDSDSALEFYWYYVYVMKFNLSSIPSNAIVTNATLTLKGGGASSSGWNIYRITNSWANGTPGGMSFSGSNVTGITLTGGTTTQRDVNVTGLVQNLVNSGGSIAIRGPKLWGSGSDLASIRGTSTDTPPRLTVDWILPNSSPYTPTVSVTGLGGAANVNWSDFTINWTFSDPDAGNIQSNYQVVGTRDGWGNWHYNSGVISNSGARSINTGALADGYWNFAVAVYDQNGAVSPWGYLPFTFTVDRTQPYASGVDGEKYTNGATRFQVYGVGDALSGVNRVLAFMRNMANTAWLIDSGTCTNAGGGTWYYDFPVPSDGQGGHLIRFHVVDNSNNWSPAYDTTWYYDTAAPTITGGTNTQYLQTAVGGTFRVQATGASDNISGVTSLKFPTSRLANGDWIWYDGVHAGAGTWYADIPISNYGNSETRYQTHVYGYDAAGNTSGVLRVIDTYVDRSAPANPSPSITSIKSTSAAMNWNAYSDAISPRQNTWIYLERWTGSAWTRLTDALDVGAVTTYNWTGLTAGTQYQATVIYRDAAGNASSFTWAGFTTNILPTATVSNISTSGYVYNNRTPIKVSGSDANGSSIVLQIQIDDNLDFSSPIVDSVADQPVNNAGWSVKSYQGSGSTNIYTPTNSLGSGTRNIRVRAFEANAAEWGAWSPTYTFTIQVPSWATVVGDTDTTISKRTIDDLRTKINIVRQARGLSAYSFTDATITAGVTMIRAAHLLELRVAIQGIADIAGQSISWGSSITAGSTNRSGSHWKELRNVLSTV